MSATFPHDAALQPATRSPLKTQKGYLGKRKRRRVSESENLSMLPEDEEWQSVLPVPTPTFSPPPHKAFAAKQRMRSRVKPVNDPHSSSFGRFSMSLKGLQRQLRSIIKSSDTPAFQSVVLIERELSTWLNSSGVVPFPADQARAIAPRVIDDRQIKQSPAIIELDRQTHQLIWRVPEPFERLLVHLVARIWDVVSFSKDDGSGQRVTYLYRPHVVKGDPHAMKGGTAGLLTPPTTEFETSSFGGGDTSDFSDGSDWDYEGEETLTQAEQEKLNGLASLQRVYSIDSELSEYADSEHSGVTADLESSIQSLQIR